MKSGAGGQAGDARTAAATARRTAATTPPRAPASRPRSPRPVRQRTPRPRPSCTLASRACTGRPSRSPPRPRAPPQRRPRPPRAPRGGPRLKGGRAGLADHSARDARAPTLPACGGSRGGRDTCHGRVCALHAEASAKERRCDAQHVAPREHDARDHERPHVLLLLLLLRGDRRTRESKVAHNSHRSTREDARGRTAATGEPTDAFKSKNARGQESTSALPGFVSRSAPPLGLSSPSALRCARTRAAGCTGVPLWSSTASAPPAARSGVRTPHDEGHGDKKLDPPLPLPSRTN